MSVGRGPVLLVHPINMRKECWLGLLPFLADRGCVLLDLSGHGESADAENLSLETWVEESVDAVEHLGLGDVHIVGGSLGGAVGLGVATHLPEVVLSVTGLGSTVLPAPPDVAPPAPATPAETDLLFDHLAEESVGPSAGNNAARTVRSFTNHHGPEIVTRILRAAFAADASSWLERVACPTLWITGAHDSQCEPDENERIGRSMGGQWEVLPGIGHLPMVEAPAQVASLLAPHLLAADALTAHGS